MTCSLARESRPPRSAATARISAGRRVGPAPIFGYPGPSEFRRPGRVAGVGHLVDDGPRCEVRNAFASPSFAQVDRNGHPMTTDELREAFLDFFVSKGCVRRPSDVLAPKEDETVLFTPA